jgi:hypothetical protein
VYFDFAIIVTSTVPPGVRSDENLAVVDRMGLGFLQAE